MPRHPSAAPLTQAPTQAAGSAIPPHLPHLPAWVAAVATWGLLLTAPPAPAGTLLVPGIPNSLPAVGFGNPMSALRVNAGGSTTATSFDATFPTKADSFSELTTDFVETGDYEQTLAVSRSALAGSGTVVAASLGRANVAFGKLGAFAGAMNTIGGFSEARASVVADFIDLLTIEGGQQVSLSGTFNVNGSVGAVVGQGSAFAFGQVWAFPFTGGPFPPTGAQFQAQFYKEAFYEPGSIPKEKILGTMKDLPPGTSYWIYARLSVLATRINDTTFEGLVFEGTSHADFEHTAQFLIEPDPGTPAGAYTTASGFDYQTVIPEPALGAAAGLLLMAGRRRRRGG